MNHVQDLMRPTGGAVAMPREADRIDLPEPPDPWAPFRRWLRITFLVFVVLPTAALFAYDLFVASPLYQAESQFVLRGDVSRTGSGASGVSSAAAAVSALNSSQEGGILVKFLPSRALIDRVQKKVDLAAVYGRDDIDALSRLAAGADVDDLAGYWSDKIAGSVDPLSGVVTLGVSAFSPEEALALNELIMRESEAMLNALLDGSRNDALRIAEQDRERAAEALEAVRREVETFRRTSGLIDPSDAGAQTIDLIYELRGQRAALSAQLQAALATLSPQAPQVRALRSRLKALDDQIDALEGQMMKAATAENLPTLISAYDALELKRAFAERTFERSELTLLRTQAEVDRWHVYLTVFVSPSLATEAVEPTPFWTAFKFFISALVVWSILALLATGTMEHRQ